MPSDNPLNEAAALRIVVHDPDRMLSGGGLDKLAAHFMQAVAVWRRVCPGCYPAGLTHISVNGQDYLHAALAAAIESATPETRWVTGPPSIHQQVAGAHVISVDWLEAELAATLNPRGIPPAGMRRISAGDPLLTRLCSLPPSTTPAFIGRLQRGFGCRSSSDAEDPSRPLAILIKNSNTSCGFSRNIIACEADPFLMEFNGRDFAFTDGRNGDLLFGRGRERLDVMHVLLHELGHWVGLPHIQGSGSIMASTLADSRCIDVATAKALQSATGQPWVPPASAAFRFKPE